MQVRRLCLVLCLFLASLPLFAQNSTTSLRGVVTDPSGAVIGGAQVSIDNPETGSKSQTVSNSHGEYQFEQIAPGRYTITVQASGFGTYKTSATLLVSQPATVDAKLKVNVDITQVDVSTTTETINTTDATIGNAVNNETIMQLPTEGRNPQTLLALQPGVLFLGNTGTADSRNGAVSGARADQTNITLDGIDNNDQFAPGAFSGVLRNSLDATEEFRVTTSNANADTGRSSGGQVNLVTKSGTNRIHGSIYEYNRTNLAEANDPINKAGQLSAGSANVPIHLIRNTYGVSLGGPLKRDRVFLFGNYEGDRRNEGQTISRQVPTASLRSGALQYIDVNGNNVTLTAAQVASMDTGCGANGTCPNGGGPNANSLKVLNAYPLPNGTLLGDGINSASYSFGGSLPVVQNVYISRLDFNPSDRHRFYVRGSFQNDTNSQAPFYPGQPASRKQTDDSRGISANYTSTVTSNLVNNLRYGFIRQSFASTGVGQGAYVSFRGFDLPEDNTQTSQTLTPTHNIVDDLTWGKGKHTMQFGANYRTYNYQNSTNGNSFGSATSNAFWLANGGISGYGGSLDPASFGYPAVNDNTDYDFAAVADVGIVAQQNASFNYKLSADGKSGTLLGQGSLVQRSFRANEFEYYVEDTFRPSPSVTLTAGLRHTILQTPYETNGQQVQPTISLHDWFRTRAQQAAVGNSLQPSIQFAPAGQSRGGKPFYPMNWGNVAPRLAIATTPSFEEGSLLQRIFGSAGKSSIRAGFGIYYDHYGEGLVANYSQQGSFSLSSQLSNPASVLTVDTAPRFTGLHDVPNLIPPAAASISYPQIPSSDPNGTGFAITNSIDDQLKTPYSEVFNASIQRQLPGGFTFEADYVGRLGRHLPQNLDLAQPLDLVDSQSGLDYYSAATMLSKALDQRASSVAPIPYFEHVFANAADPANGLTATESVYEKAFGGGGPTPKRGVRGNETAALYNLDVFCSPGCYQGKTGQFWPLQYSSLYATSSIGSSSYHAGQFILRHPMTHGVQVDVSYTYSKSLDLGSDSELNGANTTYGGYGPIQDAFNPRKNYAVSDFDTTHLLTADWVLALPYGRGKRFGSSSNRIVDGALGGWSLTGITRVSSGLPFATTGAGWPTNWQYQAWAVATAPIKTRTHFTAAGLQVFDSQSAAKAALRPAYPGEVGQRNFFRGQGYFDTDAGLHKVVSISDRVHLQLATEVFNVTNSARYDVHSLNGTITSGTLGVYSSTLTQYRRMQLSGRIDF